MKNYYNAYLDYAYALDRIMSSAYYKYRGYRAEKLLNGNVLFCLEEMTIGQFNTRIDDIYASIDKSLNRLRK